MAKYEKTKKESDSSGKNRACHSHNVGYYIIPY